MKTLTTLATVFFLTIANVAFAQNNTASVNEKTDVSGKAASIKVNSMQIAEGVVKVKLINQPKGIYTVQLLDEDGKMLAVKQIHHIEGNNSEVVEFGQKVSGGVYQVEVVRPDNFKTTEKVMLLM